MSRRSDQGWDHYRTCEALYTTERARGADRQWTAFDFRMRQACDCAVRDGDSHLVGACLELQASRWEIAGYQGEVLGALGGALDAYQRIIVPQHRLLCCDRVKQRLDNWFSVPRAFVSYARRDIRRVRAIVGHLEAVGAEVLWDDSMFIPGVDLARLIAWAMGAVAEPDREDVAAAVDDALRIAGLYLVMWSRTYANRPWTTWELELAGDHLVALRRSGRVGPRVVFVRLDDHPVPPAHRDALWIDLAGGARAKQRDQLTRAVTRTDLLGPRRAAPSPDRPQR